jgi:hypothetical protein
MLRALRSGGPLLEESGPRGLSGEVAVCVGLFLLAACSFFPHALPSPDYWWQVLAGQTMLCEHRVLLADPWTFTAAGRTWLNHEWLAEIAMALVAQLGGLSLVHVAAMLLISGAFLISASAARPRVSWASVSLGALVALANAEGRYFFDVRPYVAGYLGVALICRWMQRSEGLVSGRGRVALAVLFVVWANCHSSVLLGLGLLGLGLLLAAWTQEIRSRQAAGSLLVAVCACSCTPFGVSALLLPLQFVHRDGFWLAHLNEWARPDFAGAQAPFAAFACLTLLFACLLRKRLSVQNLAVLGVLASLCWRAWRHLPLFALASAPVWAYVAEVGLQWVVARWVASGGYRVAWSRSWNYSIALGTLIALLLRFKGLDGDKVSMVQTLFPVRAVDFCRLNRLPARVFNPYGWGGYLEYHLAPRYLCFVDGRANTLFDEATYRDFLAVCAATPGWESILQRYRVDVVMINAFEELGEGRALSLGIRRSTQWELVYADDMGDVFVRKGVAEELSLRRARSQPRGQKLERAAERAEWYVSSGEVGAASQLADCLLLQDPKLAAAWKVRGLCRLRLGAEAEALEATMRALALDPRLPYAHYNAAVLLLRRGDRARALEQVRAELKVAPGFEPALRMASQLEGHP